jgi:hypothetical protein
VSGNPALSLSLNEECDKSHFLWETVCELYRGDSNYEELSAHNGPGSEKYSDLVQFTESKYDWSDREKRAKHNFLETAIRIAQTASQAHSLLEDELRVRTKARTIGWTDQSLEGA